MALVLREMAEQVAARLRKGHQSAGLDRRVSVLWKRELTDGRIAWGIGWRHILS